MCVVVYWPLFDGELSIAVDVFCRFNRLAPVVHVGFYKSLKFSKFKYNLN